MDGPSPALIRSDAGRLTTPDPAAEFAAAFAGDGRSTRTASADQPRVGVLRNPRSHRNRGTTPMPAERAGISIAEPGDRAALSAALTAFAARGIGILVIDGGDGTVRDVLTCGARVFGAVWPRLIVLPKGKTNALAVDLGVPPKWSLSEALIAARRDKTVRRRPLVVERDGGAGTPLWGFVLGTGTFNAATDAGQKAHKRGAFQSFAVLLTLIGALARALFGPGESTWRRVWPMRLASLPDDVELPHSNPAVPGGRYLALFSTLRRLPLGIRLFRPRDRAIRYFVIDEANHSAVLRVPLVLCGADAHGDAAIGIHRGAGEEFAVDLDREGFILDGEAFAPARLRLRQGPVLHFIVP